MNRLFLTLSFLMGAVVLSSNYLVQFPINRYGLNEILTYGAFSYPIAFLITDIANRVYGKLIARKMNVEILIKKVKDRVRPSNRELERLKCDNKKL